MAPTPEDVSLVDQWIASGEVDTVIVAFPDLQGRPVGKRVTAEFYEAHVARHGIEACDYLLAVDVDMTPQAGYRFANWDTGYGDLEARIDPATARRLPWEPGSALVLCDLFDRHGAPVEVSPRRILQRQVARAAERGFVVQAATELEFYLFTQTYEQAAATRWQQLTPTTGTVEDYQLVPTGREEYVLGRVRRELLGAGIPVEYSKGEAGRGQHEVNVTYAEPVETADRHLVLKSGVKAIAAQEGRSATFMAKWTAGDSGSSCHLHTSLWDAADGAPAMAGDGPYGLSEAGAAFVAGQLHAARQLAWCAAPYLNSYRRYVPGSWAPTALAWGEDNRTCAFRVVGQGRSRRVESRLPGADANPYLALAAAIAGGLYGIDHGLELPAPYVANAYEATDVARVPDSLAEAVAAFEASEVAVEAFGEEVAFHLVHTARLELQAANAAVTDWELARNFERI